MKTIRERLKEETKRPIRALKETVVFSLKFLGLAFLRSVLWSLFFVLPILLFFLGLFHWMTEKAEEEMRRPRVSHSQIQVPVTSSAADSKSDRSWIRALSQDLRFWIQELGRFKR